VFHPVNPRAHNGSGSVVTTIGDILFFTPPLPLPPIPPQSLITLSLPSSMHLSNSSIVTCPVCFTQHTLSYSHLPKPRWHKHCGARLNHIILLRFPPLGCMDSMGASISRVSLRLKVAAQLSDGPRWDKEIDICWFAIATGSPEPTV
jgi:hypothetical protein